MLMDTPLRARRGHPYVFRGYIVWDVQADLPAIRGSVFHFRDGHQRQRTPRAGDCPPVRGAPGVIFFQRVRVGHRLQLQQGEQTSSHIS